MPKTHRGEPVGGPARNCGSEGCGGVAEHRMGKGINLCSDCRDDYMTYLPYMHEGQYASWEDK